MYRYLYPQAFAAASQHLNYMHRRDQHGVLIGSSMTMALAVRAAQLGNRRSQVVFLLLTIVLGSTFLGIKVVEYHDKFVHHLVPGSDFHFEGPYAREAQIFFSLYFAMTGMHAVHMIIGIGMLSTLTVLAWRGNVLSAVLHAGRARRTLLALRRHRVDLSLPVALPDPGGLMSRARRSVQDLRRHLRHAASA